MIDPKWIVRLKGRDYPQYAGVLDAATKAGLKSLAVRVLQIPTADNGNLAVVEATAIFDDGRSFTDLGDCSPASTTPQLAAASLRLASTRAKGRALRDSVNVGQTMYEELPDARGDSDDDEMGSAKHPPGPAGNGAAAARPPQHSAGGNVAAATRPAAGSGDGATVACEEPGCGVLLTKNQITMSQHKTGGHYCPAHSGAHAKG